MNSRSPNRRQSLRQSFSQLLPYKNCVGYFIAGLTAVLAFTGVCLMSCDSRIRRQEAKITQFESDDFSTDLGLLHGLHKEIMRSLREKTITCHEAAANLKNIHTKIMEKEQLAQSGFFLAGLRWTKVKYFDEKTVNPIMCFFLVSAVLGVTCIIIVVINKSDTLSSRLSGAFTSIMPASSEEDRLTSAALRRIPVPLKTFKQFSQQSRKTGVTPSSRDRNLTPSQTELERIPKCYKLKELESDLESITRLELDDQEAENDYVYGPWRVYCESRDGNVNR
ncbi:hypothetical protein BV898_12293 [Hypsibius exemplaris]|uniref:Uncharacterized protein n=1 Tax=Hypsibius exemplaris TaxID=2072580 RepID=A0A1W0WE20_HYPEX|nr:hypothetical protein BV898_12293 [Hypsibius exemplaris]